MRLLILCIIFISSGSIFSQSLISANRNSNYTYIYKINASDAKIINENKFDTYYSYREEEELEFASFISKFLYHKIDSISFGNKVELDKLNYGNYLIVNSKFNKAKIEIVSISNYTLDVISDYKKSWLKVNSLSNKIEVPKFIILDGKKVTKNDSLDLFQIQKNKKNRTIEVIVNKDTLLYSLENSCRNLFLRNLAKNTSPYILYRSMERVYDRIYYGEYYDRNPVVEGYLLFNKPKYLPKDTVKLKLLLLDEKNKYYKKPVKLRLTKRYHGYNNENNPMAILNPNKDGGYTYEFALSDSLELNYYYEINVYDKKDNLLKKNSFYLEDYQLDEITYNVTLPKEKYNASDSVILIVTSKDANGFNSLDSRAEIKITTFGVDNYFDSEVFVPEVLWRKKIQLDPLGETRVQIPKSSLPSAEIRLMAEILFNNSNNEMHEVLKNFTYDGRKKWLEAKIIFDSLFVSYLPNNSKEKAWLYSINKDTLSKTRINLPYSEKINHSVQSYVVKTKLDQVKISINSSSNKFDCEAYKIKDTVNFLFNNPNKILINYFIYDHQGKVLEKGRTINLNKKIIDKSKNSYYLSCHFVYGGELIEREYICHTLDKLLKVKIEQPERVVPGESLEVKVIVNDYLDNPIEDANILANSLNGQFEKFELPEIPYLGGAKYRRKRKSDLKIFKEEVTSKVKLNRALRDKMNLNSQLYYQLAYPGTEIKLVYDSSFKLKKPQFSPFLFKKGVSEKIYSIHLDGKLIYWAEHFSNNGFAFEAEEGYHTITLRTRNEEVELDSIYLRSGCKLDFSVDINSYKHKESIKKSPPFLDYDERKELENSTLILGNLRDYGTVYIWQGDKIIEKKAFDRVSYIERLGPFESGDTIHFASQDGIETSFVFEPYYIYYLYKGLVKMVSNKGAERKYLRNEDNEKWEGEIYYTPVIKINHQEEKIISTVESKTPVNNETGRFKFKVDSEKEFLYLRLSHKDSAIKRGFSQGTKRNFPYEKPGFYELVLLTKDSLIYSVDSIEIKANGWNYRKFENIDFIKSSLEKGIKKYNIDSNLVNSITPKKITNNYKNSIVGKVVDKETGEPLPFAIVRIGRNRRSFKGAITDLDGKFIISNILDGSYSVRVSFIGYKTQYVTVFFKKGQETELLIELSNDDVQLSEFTIIDAKRIPRASAAMMSISSSGVYNRMRVRRKRKGVAKGFADPYLSDYNATRLDYEGYDDQILDKIEAGNVSDSTGNSLINGNQSLFGRLKISHAVSQNRGIPTTQLRKSFSDNGYWQPTLVTNEKGEVVFRTKFPDNITKWKSYAVAYTENSQNGIGYTESMASKPLMAQLSTPRFLVEGDSSILIGKISNYTNKPASISTSFSMNKKFIKLNDTSINLSLIQYLPISTRNLDSLIFKYTVTEQNGYSDGEERKIPLLRKGISENSGKFYSLNKDTLFTTKITNSNKKILVNAYATELGPMMEVIEELKNYKHGCMEQTASKIRALLCEKKIKAHLNESFYGKTKIKRLIKRLEKGQNEDGSWGWWSKTSTDLWMTTYVANTLVEASEEGFRVSKLSRTVTFLRWKLAGLKGDKFFEAFHLLSKMERSINFESRLKKPNAQAITLYQKMLLIQAKQKLGLDYSVKPILDSVQISNLGNYYWGKSNNTIHQNVNNLTALAFQILEKEDSNHLYLNKITAYFLESKSKNGWRNTIDKAQIISSILPRFLKAGKKEISSVSLSINNKVINQFPFRKEVEVKDSKITLKKKGDGNLYISLYSENWESNPKKKDSIFNITTYFKQNDEVKAKLIAGKVTEMRVRIEVKKPTEYVMIQVPIPAGCSYDNNSNVKSSVETHREYFKDHTNIYCKELPPGIHEFVIKVQPRFTGVYTINPAYIENMYFPLQYGRNGIKNTEISSGY